MLIAGGGELSGCLVLAFGKQRLAKVGAPRNELPLGFGHKLFGDAEVRLTILQLRGPERGGFAGKLLGEQRADKISVSPGGEK